MSKTDDGTEIRIRVSGTVSTPELYRELTASAREVEERAGMIPALLVEYGQTAEGPFVEFLFTPTRAVAIPADYLSARSN